MKRREDWNIQVEGDEKVESSKIAERQSQRQSLERMRGHEINETIRKCEMTFERMGGNVERWDESESESHSRNQM